METYRVDIGDGLEHIIRVLEIEENVLSCETIHGDGIRECRVGQNLDKCLFEEIVALGLITPV